jgi:hypothetical protein
MDGAERPKMKRDARQKCSLFLRTAEKKTAFFGGKKFELKTNQPQKGVSCPSIGCKNAKRKS